MCIVCHLADYPHYTWHVCGFWGKWYNFIPPKYRWWELLRMSPYDHSREKDKYWYYDRWYRPWRGEGNPAPWLMMRWRRYGLQLELQRSRPWTHPEFYKENYPQPTSSLMWGFFIFAWTREQ